MEKTVTKIPAKKNIITSAPLNSITERRVAAYARVSTDSDEQLTSYEAQVDYYKKYIANHPDWKFVNIYTDEGISACTIKFRSGFQSMIDDALSGKIDLIITKSISRFARNTVDSLVTIRKLKEHGVECYFEKENIWTFDSKGELLITIMSSIAQEESRSISENVTWGHRKRMADGKILLPYSQFLGYRKGADGFPEIVPEEAEIVRLIYRSFMEGLTPNKICQKLMKDGILSPAGKKKWYTRTVESILKNEKYKGSALLQKSFTVDFLTKKKKKNEGEVPQYYVENSHPAIISAEDFEQVQAEFERRKTIGKMYSSASVFSSKIKCGCCGSFFGSKVWHSTDKYRKVIWQCNNKYSGQNKCNTPHIQEDTIKEKFIEAYNAINQYRNEFFESCKIICETLSDESKLDDKLSVLYSKLNNLEISLQAFIKENAMHPQEKNFYEETISDYDDKRKFYETEIESITNKKAKQHSRKEIIENMIRQMKMSDSTLKRFDEKLCRFMIDSIIVNTNGKLRFIFWNGMTYECE